MKYIFRDLRRERESFIRYLNTTRTDFRRFLQKLDAKQTLLSAFQKSFNEVDDDLRCGGGDDLMARCGIRLYFHCKGCSVLSYSRGRCIFDCRPTL